MAARAKTVKKKRAARKTKTRRTKTAKTRVRKSTKKTARKLAIKLPTRSRCCGYEIARAARANTRLRSTEYAEVTYLIRPNVGGLVSFSGVPVTLNVVYGPGETIAREINPITVGTATIVYRLNSGVVFRNCPRTLF